MCRLIVIMIQAARASSRSACRSVVAEVAAGAARQQSAQLLRRACAVPSRPRNLLFSGAQPRCGLASAVAATRDGDIGLVNDDEGDRRGEVIAEVAAPKEQQPAETKAAAAPRRRRLLRERPAPITLVSFLCEKGQLPSPW